MQIKLSVMDQVAGKILQLPELMAIIVINALHSDHMS